MIANLIIIIFMISNLSTIKAQDNALKLNIREIPLDPFNASDEIGVMIFIIDLEPFSELNMDYKIDYLLKQVWYPHSNFCVSLFDDLEISPSRKRPFKPIDLYDEVDLRKIWLPDTFVSNSKGEKISSDVEILEMVSLFMLNPHKCVIEYWTKLNAKVTCPLYLKYYPFDAVNDRLLHYKWIGKNDNDFRGFKYDSEVFLTDGVVLLYPLRLAEYDVDAFSGSSTDSLCKFSSIFVTFVYKRRIFEQLLLVYVPSVLLFLVSLLSLWIDIDEVGRVLNCMTCFLSLITQFVNVRSELPVTSYINGTDMWMLTILMFVFLNLVQFTFAKYVQNKANSNLKKLTKKSSLNDEMALNDYLMQKNRERFQMVKKLKTLNRNKSTNSKRTELLKYLAIQKFPTKQTNTENQRLRFIEKRNVKDLNFRSFLSDNELFSKDRLFSFSNGDEHSNYDRVLKAKIDRLVKYNSSSSSSSDSESEEEDSWYQKTRQDFEVHTLINKIDHISRILFSLAFVLFNLFYWPYMNIMSK